MTYKFFLLEPVWILGKNGPHISSVVSRYNEQHADGDKTISHNTYKLFRLGEGTYKEEELYSTLDDLIDNLKSKAKIKYEEFNKKR